MLIKYTGNVWLHIHFNEAKAPSFSFSLQSHPMHPLSDINGSS